MMFKNKNIIALLFYIIVISTIYAPVVFFGKSLLPSLYYPEELAPFGYEGRKPINTFDVDLATPSFFEQPINRLVGNMYLKRKFPLWNPYQGLGMPLAAQYSTCTFFPYQILEDISPWWLWDYFILGRLIIAGFFTYLFLKLLGLSLTSSFLGGIFYSLSGSFVWFINLEQFTNVAMMVPVSLFSLERLIQFKKKRYLAESAFVFGLVLLAGQPEIAIYALLLAALYYLFRISMEKENLTSFIKKILKFIIVIFLGLSLAAVLILPFFEYLFHSFHSHLLGGTMGTENPTSLHLVPAIFIPSYFDMPTFWRIFPLNGTWDYLGGYIGVLPAFLITLALFCKKNPYHKYIYFFGIFGFLIVLKNFGSPLISWIGKIPLLDMSWSPRWAGPVWVFSLACAGTFGMEIIFFQKNRMNLALSLISIAILERWFYIPRGMESTWSELKIIPLAVGFLTAFAILRQKKYLAIFGILIFIMSNLFIELKSPYGFPERYNLFKKAPYVEFLEKKKDYFRVMAEEGILMPNFSSAFGIFDVRYIASLSPAIYQHYVDCYLLSTPHPIITNRLWFLGSSGIGESEKRSIESIEENLSRYSYLGVKYILTSQNVVLNLPLVYNKEVKIYENLHPFDRAYIAHDVRYASDYREAQKLMYQQDFDIKNCVALEEKAPEWFRPVASHLNSKSKIEEYEPDRVVISCEIKEDGIMVLTDTFYPGWTAYVDGKRTKIYRVNGLVRGIFLKKGTHAIIFKYFPNIFKISLLLTGISVSILFLILFL